METGNAQNNPAKYAFFYMLSLVALVFMSLSTGMIIFQIINKSIADVLTNYPGQFNTDLLKFAISALIISAPIYFILMRQIHKSLFSGALEKDSGIRKWLTYFILFATSCVMIGWLIATLNNFFNGDLTLKFILKSATAIIIAAAVFTFYFYDIRREQVTGSKSGIIRIYLYASLAVVIASFVASLFFVESPTQARNRKFDNAILEDFNNINSAINTYYGEKKALPGDLGALKAGFPYITDDTMKDNATGEAYRYNIVNKDTYELCAIFRTSNKDKSVTSMYSNFSDLWPHDAGDQCLKQKIWENNPEKGAVPNPAM